MNKLQKFLIASCTIIASQASACDTGIKLSIGGSVDGQYGIVDQRDIFKTNLSGGTTTGNNKLNTNGFVSDAKFTIKADGKTESLSYGAFVKLNANTSVTKSGSSSIADMTYIYAENNFGRLELGSPEGSSSKMQVSAIQIAAATGGIDGDAQYWMNQKSGILTQDKDNKPKFIDVSDAFITSPYLPVGCECSSKSNKLSYYTPKYMGFSGGYSFIPDINVKGTIGAAGSVTKTNTYGTGYKNIHEFALNYEGKVNDFGYKFGATYQVGDAKKPTDSTANAAYLRKGISAYELGAQVSYKDFTIAGSYGDWGKSGALKTPADNMKSKSDYYTLGAAFKYEKLNASLTYFSSRKSGADISENGLLTQYQGHNKFEMISLGLNYDLAPGIMPYAEVNFFKNKTSAGVTQTKSAGANAGAAVQDNSAAKSNKGNVFLVGTKISF